jgi:glycosyltransferase involved in cell wall biosynthesis
VGLFPKRARMVDQYSGNQRPRVADATSRVDVGPETGTLPPSAGPELDRLSTIFVLGPDIGDVGGVSTHLAQMFSSSLSADFRLIHFQTGSGGRRENRWGRLWRAIDSPVQLVAATARHRPRIMHINSAPDSKAFWRDAVYLVLAKSMGRQTVLEMHGSRLPTDYANGSRLPTDYASRNRVRQAATRRILRLANRIVLLSEFDFVAYQNYDPRLSTVVIPNAVEVLAGTPPRKPVSDDAPLKLIYIGRLIRAKGIFETVEAVRLLQARNIHVRLDIVGAGPDSEELRRSIVDAGVQECVQMLGPQYGADKKRVLEESDVLVFPTYGEGLPYVLLESMAAGTVPVTCPVGGIPDVLSKCQCGITVPPRDPSAVAEAVHTLHRDREMARALSEAAHRVIVEHYQVSRMASDFRRLYERM